MEAAAELQAPATSGKSPRHRPARRPNQNRSKTNSDTRQDDDGPWKVQVSGYPKFTQPHDLKRAFSSLGAITICKFTNDFAVLGFPSEETAARAIRMANVQVYGVELQTKWFLVSRASGGKQKPPPQQQNQKRDFARSKQKGVIVAPKDIDLSGNFLTQLDQVLGMVRLTLEEVTSLNQLYSDVENALQKQWPGCTAMPFGSITTGLGIKTSDADCFVLIPDDQWLPNYNHVNKAKNILHQYPKSFAELLSIPRANTPIVKFFHIPTETNCDLTFKTLLGVQNSKLISFMLHYDPRLLPMAILIKYWAKVHELSGTGKLTNYALTMLIIFYLQQPPVSILPSVRSLQQDSSYDFIVDCWNTGIKSDTTADPAATSSASISELLGGFFEFYSRFDFAKLVVCPYLGKPIEKAVFNDHNQLPEGFEMYKENVEKKLVYPIRNTTAMCVQDPFEQCHNTASALSHKFTSDIVAHMKFAANAYEKEKPNECEKFLRIILLEAPEIGRGKQNPEFRVRLFPKILNELKDPEWKSIITGIMMTIFEKMLKLKLEPVENKENQEPAKPESRKTKERYLTTVTRAIWKRKQFARMNGFANLSFVEKQERITEEVLKTETQEYKITYNVFMTFCNDPKSFVVSIKMVDATEKDVGREFGKFFLSVLQNWTQNLLISHLSKIVKKPSINNVTAVDTCANNNQNEETNSNNDVSESNGSAESSSQ